MNDETFTLKYEDSEMGLEVTLPGGLSGKELRNRIEAFLEQVGYGPQNFGDDLSWLKYPMHDSSHSTTVLGDK